jgi:insulysin
LDTLQQWIVERYSKIPVVPESEENKTEIELLIDQAAAEAPPNSLNEPPPLFRSAFSPIHQGGSWPVLVTTKPLKSMRKVVVLWPIPSNDNRVPDHSASSILSHLLGHEGAGSAFAVLQDHGMLNSLSAGPRTRAPDFTLFQVDLGLTEKGEQHWQEVVDIIFGYCRLLKDKLENNPHELARIWGEVSRLDQMFFHQTSPGGVYSYAPNLADRILSYGTEKALSAGRMLDETEDSFPLEKVKDVVKLLTPANAIVERCSETAWEESMNMTINEDHGFGKQTEQWYGIEYHLSKIHEDVISSWNGVRTMDSEMNASSLTLPRPNRYIPRTLDLCPDLPEEAKQGPRLDKPIDPPNLLVDDANGRLFHRLDDRYALPQSSLTFLIRNAAIQNVKTTPAAVWEYDDKTALLSSMLAGAFGDAMAQENYDAELAGLHWSLNMTPSGIKLSFFGFSDRLPDLALTILSKLIRLPDRCDEERYTLY